MEEIDGSLVDAGRRHDRHHVRRPGRRAGGPPGGVQKRLFVYDVGEGPRRWSTPRIVETGGEWYYDEGCLSIPGLRLGIVRPDRVHLRGLDLDGEELSIEADEFLGRVFQHEVDHLDGVYGRAAGG